MGQPRAARMIVAGMLAATMVAGWSVTPVAAAKSYKNCTALNKVYAHGVGKPKAKDKISGKYQPGRSVDNFYRSKPLYNANSGLDRDGDGVACEQR